MANKMAAVQGCGYISRAHISFQVLYYISFRRMPASMLVFFLYIYLNLLTRWITTLCLLNSFWRENCPLNKYSPLDTRFHRQLLAFVAVSQLSPSSNYRQTFGKAALFSIAYLIFSLTVFLTKSSAVAKAAILHLDVSASSYMLTTFFCCRLPLQVFSIC